jgi:hypothetical protein
MDLKIMEYVDWIDMAQDETQQQAPVTFGFQKVRNVLSSFNTDVLHTISIAIT